MKKGDVVKEFNTMPMHGVITSRYHLAADTERMQRVSGCKKIPYIRTNRSQFQLTDSLEGGTDQMTMKKGDVVLEFNPFLLQRYEVVVTEAEYPNSVAVSSGRCYEKNAKGNWTHIQDRFPSKVWALLPKTS